MKSLQSILQHFDLDTSQDIKVTDITLDSRLVKPGTLFCAVKGHHFDGNTFIESALKQGACAVLCEQLLPESSFYESDKVFAIPDLYHRLGELANFFYDNPSQKLKVVGVTGTNGKTSTTHYLAELVYLLGQKSAVIGTVGNGVWGQLHHAERTTPDVLSLHQLLHDFVNQGIEWVAMEVSSHALDQNRVDGVNFYAAIFTNLTQDHLDYHITMQAYAAAKAKLFQKPGLKFAILNQEDPFTQALVKYLPLKTRCEFYDTTPLASTQLLGQFNIANVNAALTLLATSGFELAEIKTRATLLHAVKGRMETLRYPDAPLVVIDYAHTPDALIKAMQTLKEYAKPLWVVFGCGGDRDSSKRALMAAAVEQNADHIIVTEDNSRSEPIENIFADIRTGFTHPDQVQFIPDRTEAIQFTLKHAKANDIILLAGKGHETYMEKNGNKTYYDEREVVQKILAKSA